MTERDLRWRSSGTWAVSWADPPPLRLGPRSVDFGVMVSEDLQRLAMLTHDPPADSTYPLSNA
jgi:hypothetical protein